jgi:hypothetical protein
MQFPTNPETIVPHLDPRKDTGPYVEALVKLPPNSTVLAASVWCTWPDWIELWGSIVGVETSYKQVEVANLDEHIPGGAGKEIGEMFKFSSEYGYNVDQANTLKNWDLEKVYFVFTLPLQLTNSTRYSWALLCRRLIYKPTSRL